MPKPKPPPSLAKAGRALWRSIQNDLEDGWQLDSREQHSLAQACRAEDHLSRLDAIVEKDGATIEGSRGQVTVHPCLVESRHLRGLQLRLLSIIEMSSPSAARQSATPAQSRARHAATVRWSRN